MVLNKKSRKHNLKVKQEDAGSISALIATILLIVIAVAMVFILLNWGRDFTLKSTSLTEKTIQEAQEYNDVFVVNRVYPELNKIVLKNSNLEKDFNVIGYKVTSAESYPFLNVYTTLDVPVSFSSSGLNSLSLDCLPSGKSTLQLYTTDNAYINLVVNFPYNPSSCQDYNTSLVLSPLQVSPVAGSFTSEQDITLSSTDSNVIIYYTLDGSTPTEDSLVYSSPITIPLDSNIIIKAISTKEGYYSSEIYSGTYYITHTLSTPVASIPAGTYFSSQSITLLAEEGSNIYFTLDGSTPTEASALYTVAITMSSTTTLKAISVKDEYARSDIYSGIYSFAFPIQLSAGYRHTCITYSNGTIYCFGGNYAGQLGDGTLVDKNIPTLVIDINNAIKVGACGTGGGQGSHTCALLNDGQIKCWGDNAVGQLGDGTTIAKSTPTYVSGINNAVDIYMSGPHSCALLSTGTIKCWGFGQYGQLGDGNTNYSNSLPVDVNITDVNQVSTGGFHTCALLNNGTVKCWGYNGDGRVGDGTTTQRTTPVFANITAVKKISIGYQHSCALLIDGNIKCWGMNDYGQIGDGTLSTRVNPVYVSGLSNILDLSSNGRHNCVILDTNDLKCWGANLYGQLGDNTSTRRPTPVSVLNISDVKYIDTGGNNYSSDGHTCAIKNDNNIMCWGNNEYGQLGDGTKIQRRTPVYVLHP